MTLHIDKYGRTWNWTPGHDTNQMLQISPELMHMAYRFSLAMRTQNPDFVGAHTDGWPVPNPDCYLLKHPAGWWAGIRLSDEGHDYLSPGFQDGIIAAMVEGHQSCAYSRFEAEAIRALLLRY